MFVMDLASEVYRANTLPTLSHINVGSGKDIAIADLAAMIAEVVGYNGRIVYDPEKPDGTPRKIMDVGRLEAMGWKAQIALRDGIAQTYKWYLNNRNGLRTL